MAREGAGADAAGRADHSDPRLLLGRGLDDSYWLQLLGAIEGRDQGFLGDWLDEVVAGAGIDDVTVDGDIVHRSDADDLGAVREGRAERQHGGLRRGGLGHVDDQHRGRRRAAEILDGRSEEHTSELQSLMRISYAVFCLKKKKKKQTNK